MGSNYVWGLSFGTIVFLGIREAAKNMSRVSNTLIKRFAININPKKVHDNLQQNSAQKNILFHVHLQGS